LFSAGGTVGKTLLVLVLLLPMALLLWSDDRRDWSWSKYDLGGGPRAHCGPSLTDIHVVLLLVRSACASFTAAALVLAAAAAANGFNEKGFDWLVPVDADFGSGCFSSAGTAVAAATEEEGEEGEAAGAEAGAAAAAAAPAEARDSVGRAPREEGGRRRAEGGRADGGRAEAAAK
jgi:hypothetical protein